MALIGRDYDRLYGTWGTGYTGYDRGYNDRWGGARDYGYNAGRYPSALGYMNDQGYSNTNRDLGYDNGFRGYGMSGYGYDTGYRSRWETDNGDPFGDRSAHTPMRVVRNRAGYDLGFRANGYGRDYYSANPMGYEPYRRDSWGMYDRDIRRGRRYDNDWF
ncbi:MAG TPA: hypothetical protein VFI96_05105 [Longimicrobiaceae bacterium]|nr:hypothetical protein [Longimicrobiaceae bacterium]